MKYQTLVIKMFRFLIIINISILFAACFFRSNKTIVMIEKSCTDIKQFFTEEMSKGWKTDSLGTSGDRSKLFSLFPGDSLFNGIHISCVDNVLGVPNKKEGSVYIYNIVSNRPGSNAWLHLPFNRDSLITITLIEIE